jgi:hypothetical protein
VSRLALVVSAERVRVESVNMPKQARSVDRGVLLCGIHSMVETMQHVQSAKGEHAMPLVIRLPLTVQLPELVGKLTTKLPGIISFDSIRAALG